MTHGTIGGIIVSDLIQGVDNKWADFYSPKRTPLKKPKTFLAEMSNMTKQYGDFLISADINEINELSLGQGAILSKGLKKFAVYKDERGELYAFSAVCPHLGCMVQWNGEEK